MLVTRTPSELPRPAHGLCLALGMFDGVHLGHQHVLRHALAHAATVAGASVALTFDPHPLAVVRPDRAPRLLQTLPQRLRALQALGLDAALVISFTPEIAALDGKEFIEGLLGGTGRIRSLSIGDGFLFGRHRGGTVELLKTLGVVHGFQVHVAPPVALGGDTVSSSRIRQHLREGRLEDAGELLGRPYSVSGVVIAGDQMGRRLGFPTANLDVRGLELPPHGVYAVRARRLATASDHPAVLNIGTRPTISGGGDKVHFEVHLLDFDAALYDEELEITPIQRLRDERRFPDPESLRRQIAADIAAAREVLED